MQVSGYAPFVTVKEREMPVFVATIGNPNPQNTVHRPLGISDFMILYTAVGEGVCETGDGETELREGSFLFVPPGKPHEYHMKDNTWETYYITFNGKAVTDFFKDDTAVFNKPDEYDFMSVYEKIYRYKQNPHCFKEISIEAYKFIIDIREFINNEGSCGKSINVIEKAIKAMEKTQKFNLSEAAEKARMSKEHFCRIFKKYTGYRPTEYLNILKLQRAAAMLKKGDKSVGEIAEAAGYESRSYFGLLFKKYIGVSPGEYRSNFADDL